jgi:hypothetical protein
MLIEQPASPVLPSEAAAFKVMLINAANGEEDYAL